MGRIGGRLRAVLTVGAVLAGTASFVGAAQQPASAAPNQCNDPEYDVYWHSEWDMADASADWCRNWVLDPGVGKMLDRQDLLAYADLYKPYGFTRQFLWYAPKVTRTVDPTQLWSACSAAHYPDPAPNPCNATIVTNPQHDIGYDFGGPVDLTGLWWGNSFIALVCGNFSLPTPPAIPVPTISGIKFDDANHDGTQDNGEGGVGGVTFQLIRDSSYYGDQDSGEVVDTTQSAADGSFTFRLDGQGPGTYTVQEQTPAGSISTTGTTQTFPVAPGAGDTTYHVAFGNRPETPPVADAGPPQEVDQSSADGALVTLDGSKSSDADGDPLTYTWQTPNGIFHGVNPTVPIPPADGPQTITLTVNDGIEDSRPATTTVTVWPPVTVHGQDISPTEGQQFSGPVGTFTDPDPKGEAAEYSATIDWGDGTKSAGTITATGSTFTVAGDHTYAEEGPENGTVTVTDPDTPYNTGTASFAAMVQDAAIHASGMELITTNPVNHAVATFTDDNPGGPLSDFTATIDWGDGTSATPGTIEGPAGGLFTVSGQHTYAELGQYLITVYVVDDGGSTSTATTPATVYGLTDGGDFVIGDQDMTVGTRVTYWGAQWWKDNGLTGGPAPAAFKGFADSAQGTTDVSNWTTRPGNSSAPPASVPSYTAVIVSSSIGQNGSVISGDAPHVVIVRTDPGYGPDPGHAGTGTVVATLR